jgi:hypothetical protein
VEVETCKLIRTLLEQHAALPTCTKHCPVTRGIHTALEKVFALVRKFLQFRVLSVLGLGPPKPNQKHYRLLQTLGGTLEAYRLQLRGELG